MVLPTSLDPIIEAPKHAEMADKLNSTPLKKLKIPRLLLPVRTEQKKKGKPTCHITINHMLIDKAKAAAQPEKAVKLPIPP